MKKRDRRLGRHPNDVRDKKSVSKPLADCEPCECGLATSDDCKKKYGPGCKVWASMYEQPGTD